MVQHLKPLLEHAVKRIRIYVRKKHALTGMTCNGERLQIVLDRRLQDMCIEV